jgi:hypothetical protein
MTNKPATIMIKPVMNDRATGTTPINKIASRMIPISVMFRIVPNPSFSPSSTANKAITRPVTMAALPMLIPAVLARPTWNTSHGP